MTRHFCIPVLSHLELRHRPRGINADGSNTKYCRRKSCKLSCTRYEAITSTLQSKAAGKDSFRPIRGSVEADDGMRNQLQASVFQRHYKPSFNGNFEDDQPGIAGVHIPSYTSKASSLFCTHILKHHLFGHAHHGHRRSSNLG